jgi:multiple sugar transport system substrate-binding protein
MRTIKSRTRLAILVIAALAVAVLAACGSSDDNSSSSSTAAATPAKDLRGSKVTMWVMNNGPDPVADTKRILKPFERKTGVDVNVKLVGWDTQFDRIRNAAVSGTRPDITQAGTTQVPFFAALGGFNDLNSYVGQIGGKGAYAPGIWGTTQVKGRDGTWAVPWFTEARAIYYRKDALEKAGVDPKTAFATWDDFKATLEKLKSVKSIDGKPIKPFAGPGKKAFDLVHNVAPFIWSAGGEELNADATKSAIAEPNSVKGVEYYADLIKDGVFDTSALEKDGQGVENMFKGGQLATWIGGPWVLGTVARSDDKTWDDTARSNVGIAPLPQGPSGKAYAFVGGSNLMMFKNAKNKDAAWAVMKYLSQDATQKDYAGLMGMFPARLQPQEQVGQEDENHKEFLTAIKEGRSYAPIPQWAQVENTYKEKFGDILDLAAGQGGKPYSHQAVQQELQGAARAADNLLAQGA